MKNSPLRTSFRSATQATDSTRNGWMAKMAATKALGQRSPVIRRRTRNSKIAVAACSSTLVAWCPPASSPYSCVVQRWESQVSGCQLAA